jgi:hypothetical protein
MADVPQFHSVAVLTLVPSTTVEGTFFGIGFALYCMCAKLMFHDLQKGGRHLQPSLLLAYSSLIVLVTVINLANDAYGSVLLFIDHPGSIQSSFELEPLPSLDKSLSAWLIVGYITPILMVILTGAMQVSTLLRLSFPDYYCR